jgi:hypothetical protein
LLLLEMAKDKEQRLVLEITKAEFRLIHQLAVLRV